MVDDLYQTSSFDGVLTFFAIPSKHAPSMAKISRIKYKSAVTGKWNLMNSTSSESSDQPFVKRDGTNWTSVIAFTVFHVGAVAALFFFTWPAFFVAVFLYWISLSLGIGMRYHRLPTHRSYKPAKWIEYLLATCGTLALQGGPMFWVATHRIHHQFADKAGDPHTPRDGKWWSHIVWMMVGEGTHCDVAQCSRYAPDICKDRFLVGLSRYHYVPLVLLATLLLSLGGLPFLLWGVFFRTTMGLHATWMVNSLTHFWGTRRFATRGMDSLGTKLT